jgi:cathepsin B
LYFSWTSVFTMRVSLFMLPAFALSAQEQQSLEEIAAFVNSQQASWVAAAPAKFRSLDDVRPYLGAFLPGDARYSAPPVKEVRLAEEIPESFDAREQWPHCGGIAEVRDQSSCGSCWAFGSVDSFQDRACIATGQDVRYSPEDTAFCSYAGDGCQGGNTAWGWFEEVGVVSGGSYTAIGQGDTCLPYSLPPCAHHVPASEKYPACPSGEYPSPRCNLACSEKSYNRSYSQDKLKATSSYSVAGVSQIQTELMNNGPLYVAFEVYGDFETYRSGVYKHTTGGFLGGHAVELIGWGAESGEDYWLIKNSWNEEWGDHGLFKIARGVNECGIEDSVSAGLISTSPSPSPSPGPSPSPSPSPGNCDSEAIADQATCESTLDMQSGEPCQWCYLSGLHMGFCVTPAEGSAGCNGATAPVTV